MNETGTKRKTFQRKEKKRERKKRKIVIVKEEVKTSVMTRTIAVMWKKSGEAKKRSELLNLAERLSHLA